jgi:hypothetical protein
MSGPLWTLVTIIGPLLLAGVLAWALIRNRQKSGPRDIARTEQATKDLYSDIGARDRKRDETNG